MRFTSKQRLLFFAVICIIAALILHIRRTHSGDRVEVADEVVKTDSVETLITDYLASVSDINHFGDLWSEHADVELDGITKQRLMAGFEKASLALLQYPDPIPARRFCEGLPVPCDYTGRLSVLRELVVYSVYAYLKKMDKNKPISREEAIDLQQRFMRELYIEWTAEKLRRDRSMRAEVLCGVVEGFPKIHGLRATHVKLLNCSEDDSKILTVPAYANY